MTGYNHQQLIVAIVIVIVIAIVIVFNIVILIVIDIAIVIVIIINIASAIIIVINVIRCGKRLHQGLSAAARGMASQYLATRLIFQKCKAGLDLDYHYDDSIDDHDIVKIFYGQADHKLLFPPPLLLPLTVSCLGILFECVQR